MRNSARGLPSGGTCVSAANPTQAALTQPPSCSGTRGRSGSLATPHPLSPRYLALHLSQYPAAVGRPFFQE